MEKEMADLLPSENEWGIMEVLWSRGKDMTAAEIIGELGELDISPKTIRVMINRLVSKGLINYRVDERDARIYHYTAAKSRQACLDKKSERFVERYFKGNASQAVACFLQSGDITQEQLRELEDLVGQLKEEK